MWSPPGDTGYAFALQWDPNFVYIPHHLLKGLYSHKSWQSSPMWIICWWRHERSNIAGDEMPVSVVRAGEVSLGRFVWWDSSAGQTWLPWGCSGACTDGAHGDVWRGGRLKPPVFFLCPLQGLRRMHSDGGFLKRLTCWRSRSVHLEMACVHGK